MKFLIPFLALCLTGCVTKHPVAVRPIAPRPPMMAGYTETEMTISFAVVPPAPIIPLQAWWDCGCNQAMPHNGHGYVVFLSNDLINWRTVTTNRPPVIDKAPLFFYVGCHLGNW